MKGFAGSSSPESTQAGGLGRGRGGAHNGASVEARLLPRVGLLRHGAVPRGFSLPYNFPPYRGDGWISTPFSHPLPLWAFWAPETWWDPHVSGPRPRLGFWQGRNRGKDPRLALGLQSPTPQGPCEVAPITGEETEAQRQQWPVLRPRDEQGQCWDSSSCGCGSRAGCYGLRAVCTQNWGHGGFGCCL